MFRRWLFDLQLFAADGGNTGGGDGGSNAGSGDGGEGTGDGGQGNAGDDGGQGAGDEGKTFTQDELDAMIERRLARAKRQWETEAEEERKREQMTEVERLEAEKAEAEARAAERESAANQRLIRAAAQVEAVGLGVKADRVDYALRLADLSEVEVGDDGAVDTAAAKAAIEAVLKDLPELKGTTAPGRSGGDFRGSGGRGDGPTTLSGAVRDYYKT